VKFLKDERGNKMSIQEALKQEKERQAQLRKELRALKRMKRTYYAMQRRNDKMAASLLSLKDEIAYAFDAKNAVKE
jgi:hypothetical protein